MLKRKIAGINTIASVVIVMVAFAIHITPCQGQMFHVLETPTENTFIASSFINDNEGWLADDQGILWQTTDAGVSLEPIFSGKKFLKLYFISALNGFALAEEDAYKTNNGGESWQPLQLGNCSALWFVNSNTGFMSSSHKIYKTINGGSNWSTINVEIPPVTDLYFVSESTGIACTADRELYQSI